MSCGALSARSSGSTPPTTSPTRKRWSGPPTCATASSRRWSACAPSPTSWSASSPTTSGRCPSTRRCSSSARRTFAGRLWTGRPAVRLQGMRYLLLIHQGDSPTPQDPDAWATLSEDEQRAVFAGYQALNQSPGVTPGEGMAPPADATTVRVKDGETLVTDGPYAETKDAVGGYFFLEA